ncbi:hypothetical protein [Halobaculum limi]|uniref:hypothetical protein n=1 Tax=Halobaculum limi TaxID=3031916 RepID=UPI0024057BE9|nr:hypothetical protein [Halobaculum sp. YSMS11]
MSSIGGTAGRPAIILITEYGEETVYRSARTRSRSTTSHPTHMTLDPSETTPDSHERTPVETQAGLLIDAFLEHEDVDAGVEDAITRLRTDGYLWDALELLVVAQKDPDAAGRLLVAAGLNQ